jgi:hypothetical protein
MNHRLVARIDTEYKLTDEHYTIDDFIEDLKKKDTSETNWKMELLALELQPRRNVPLDNRH